MVPVLARTPVSLRLPHDVAKEATNRSHEAFAKARVSTKSLPKLPAELQLHTTLLAAVADVVPASRGNARRWISRLNLQISEHRLDLRNEAPMPAADHRKLAVSGLIMYGQNDLSALGEADGLGLVKVCAGHMKSHIAGVLDSQEGVEGELPPGDLSGQLIGVRLDPASVGRHDQNPFVPALFSNLKLVILPLGLVPEELAHATVAAWAR